ncbi:MAG TPA: phosphate ABC transporter permease PstA [Aliidongia sp.]|nr:phosphate ABC transporter permease PstA [Aliidongia sp.]
MAASFDLGRYNGRRRRNRVVLTLAMIMTGIGLLFLAVIMLTLLINGVPSLAPSLFYARTPSPGPDIGGLGNAIIGSVYMTGVGMLIGTPIGILAGTYLSEYSRGNKLGQVIQFINDILLSAPSIIIGVFVSVALVIPMHGATALAGGVALSLLVIPVVVRSTYEMLQLVPNGLREAAAALGTPKWKVITVVCYKAATQGMITGVILALARVSGETAPLLFTAGYSQFWKYDLLDQMPSLPVVIFIFANNPAENWRNLAWGGALLITATILILNIIARSLANLSSVKQ